MRVVAPAASTDDGCVFVVGDDRNDNSAALFCNEPCLPGSAYCRQHHTLCCLPNGSPEARRKLREIAALAKAIGGRQGSDVREPPVALLDRLDRLGSRVARPHRSRSVPQGATMSKQPRADPSTRSNPVPTAERRRQGPIEQVQRAIADTDGHPSRPYRAVDTLALMQRRGSITAAMRQAGEDFRARFTIAQLDPLRAIDPAHLRFGERSLRPEREAPGVRIETARRSVWEAIQAVGGIGSPAGSCLWNVLGWECSLKEWALERGWSGRYVSQEAASGILVAALGALDAHFAGRRPS
jgi:hypothetical protein